MVTLRGSNTNYQLSPHDEDLQDTPPLTGTTARLRNKEGAAKTRAIARLSAATGIQPLSLAMFSVTRTAVGDASASTPVEWRYVVTTGQGNRTRTWTLMVDMDNVPAGVQGNGPDRPHVGYSYWCTGYDPVARVNGHIFVEYVSASR